MKKDMKKHMEEISKTYKLNLTLFVKSFAYRRT